MTNFISHFLTLSKFRVPDLNVACTNRCEIDSLDCFAKCDVNDTVCWSQCLREHTECLNSEYFNYYKITCI